MESFTSPDGFVKFGTISGVLERKLLKKCKSTYKLVSVNKSLRYAACLKEFTGIYFVFNILNSAVCGHAWLKEPDNLVCSASVH